MAYTVDLFGSDSLLGDPNDLDNLVEFGDGGINSDNEAAGEHCSDGEEKGDEDGSKKKDSEEKAKKVVRIKRPQPKLNAERLRGPRGLLNLKKSFDGIKFQGKGHEPEDLQRIMACLEHWSHRLYPKFQFDDFLEKVEKLGTQRPVVNFIKRIRMGLEDDNDTIKSDNEEAVDDPDLEANDSMGEFDRLLAEQVSLHDSLAAQTPKTPAAVPGRGTTVQSTQAVSSTPSSLTPEQRARIEANRLAAMERRRTRAGASMKDVGLAPLPSASEVAGGSLDANRNMETTTGAPIVELDHEEKVQNEC